MKKLLALLFFCLAALTPAAFAEEGGALLTLKVNNIQVHAKWEDSHDNFSIDNGKLLIRWRIGSSYHRNVITISVEDNFKALNESYVNLTAVATISIALFPNLEIFIMGGYSDEGNPAQRDVWSSSDGKIWSKEPSPGWLGRQGLQVVKHNSTIYVLGGNNGSNLFNDVWSSTDGKNWMVVNISASWTPRSGHQAVVHNGTIYVVGGNDGVNHINDVWSSVDGKSWMLVTTNADWPVRQLYQVVSFQGTMYMMGGVDGSFVNKNDVWSSTDGKTWSPERNADWSARYGHKTVVHNDKIYVLGGRTNDGANDVWFSADGKTWEEAKGTIWTAVRDRHQAVSRDGLLYVLGGTTNALRGNDVWSSSDGQNWTLVVPSGEKWTGRNSFGAIVFP